MATSSRCHSTIGPSSKESRTATSRLMEEPVLEDVFLYAVFRERQRRLKSYKVGNCSTQCAAADVLLRTKGLALNEADQRRLARKLMEIEIEALKDLSAGSETTFDGIVERSSLADPSKQPTRTHRRACNTQKK